MKCSLLVLSSYLDGELESRRQGELEAHLVGCQRCRAGLGYLREEVERIGALGRVQVADHSVHALLVQLGLAEDDADLMPPGVSAATAVAERPAAEAPSWLNRDAPLPGWPPPPSGQEPEANVDISGFRWVPPTTAQASTPTTPAVPDKAQRSAAEDDVAPPAIEPPPPAPTFTWRSAPPTPERDGGVPAVPFGADAPPPAVPPAGASDLEPPRGAAPPIPTGQGPPPLTADQPDHTPSAPPSGGAFPPGGPETSDLPQHVTDPGGEPEMTASPPWTTREAPPEPLYPMTDEDVLDAPVPIERFGPPQQATRPSLFERLRDRLATRRALARSSSTYDDSVQIVSGSGAPLRFGRARLEVERRRQETLRMDPGAIPGSAIAEPFDDALVEDDELGLGPLPPPAVPLGPSSPMPRPAPRPSPPLQPGQMSLPGTPPAIPHPRKDEVRPPLNRTPMPPARHTLGAALGEVIPPSRVPLPPAGPPSLPLPDPLGEALAGLDRPSSSGAQIEPRPWRPREIPEDVAPVAIPPRRYTSAPSRPSSGQVPSPSQLREGRRLLGLFGAATLLMLVVGIASGRTTSPLPLSPTAHSSTPPKPQVQATHPAPRASASAPAQTIIGPPAAPAQQPPASASGQLTGVKVLGDSGTGFQIRDFRYGIHPGDFRIVLDLDASGTTTGTSPKATIGFLDSTTLIVALDGVVAAGSTGQLPSSNPVVSLTLLPNSPIPGATAYQIKLAHPVTFAAGYATGPLRLVIDIAS